MKTGRLVGVDKYGNKYYEDPSQFYGRNRWVEYATHVHLNYDGSQIPAEWFGWMHYKVSLAFCNCYERDIISLNDGFYFLKD